MINEKSGLVVMGKEWAFIALTKTENGLQLGMYKGTYFEGYDKTEMIESVDIKTNSCYLKVEVNTDAVCSFSYSLTGEDYKPIGKNFTATKGTWIGAKVGIFNLNPNIIDSKGYTDFDWFRIE